MFSSKSGGSILKGYREDILRCVKCGSCRAVCPSFFQAREESMSARGRIALIKAVLEGRLRISEIYEDRLETCMGCFACEAACASNVPVCDIIQAAKMHAVEESGTRLIRKLMAKVLTNDVMRSAAWLAPLALHYNAGSVKGNVRGARSKLRVGPRMTLSGVQRKGQVVFFPGCAINYFQPDIGTALIDLLDRMGYEVTVPEGLKCCGRPLLSLGDQGAAKELAVHNQRLLAGLDTKYIVTACPSCSLTLKKEYPKLLPPGDRMPALLDIHRFLADSMDAAGLSSVDESITWHDPCHLGRGQGLARTARDIMGRIPGVKFIEMKDADRCCGFGGTMRVTHPRLSDAIAAEKVKSIVSTKASTVVTGCPACRMQILEGLRRAGSGVRVIHTVQLLEEAMTGGKRNGLKAVRSSESGVRSR